MVEKKTQKIAGLVITTLAFILLVCLPVSAGNFTTWRSMSSGTISDLHGVWGTTSNDVFAVGSSGTITHYDGSAWSPMSSGTTNDLHGVWGANSNDVFAVGNSGTIIHYDGSAWSSVSSGTTEDINSIWGADGNDAFAVGNFGTVIHYDGSAWGSMSDGNTSNLHGIWGASSNDVFAVGSSGTVIHYDGFTWGSMSSGNTSELHGVWGANGNDVFAVGSSGTIIHYDGSAWSPMNRNTTNELRTVRGFSSSDVFAAGGSGTIVRYMPPSITSISPDHGDQGATINITIVGTNLTGATEVRLGTGIAVNSFSVLSSNQIAANITIVTGAAIGARDVSVTTPSGSFALSDSFTINQALPTITSISPNQDRQGTTLNVTITGTNLTGATEVQFGTVIAVNSFSVLSSNQITANITIVAGAETGARDVSVTTSGGSFVLPNSFTVKQALPTITSVSPNQGNQETTFIVTITGANLTGATEVRLGTGIAVNSFNVLSSNQIAANISIALGSEMGTRDVSVTTPGGSFALPNSFTVKQALPTITLISPDNGSQGATLNITITGRNLIGASELRLGTGIAVNSFTVISSNQVAANITIVAGAETGVRNVSVTTPGGSFALPNCFTVKQALPTITSISPDNGSQGATLSIIISGSNLNGATSISLGTGVAVQGFTNLSQTQLRVNVMIGEKAATGVRDVSVTTPGGSSTLGNSFNIKEKSLGTLVVALIWVGIAIVVALFILILNTLRKKRATKF